MEAVFLRTILRHDMLSIAIMRLAEHDVLRQLKKDGLLSNYKQQPFYNSGYWHLVHDRDYPGFCVKGPVL